MHPFRIQWFGSEWKESSGEESAFSIPCIAAADGGVLAPRRAGRALRVGGGSGARAGRAGPASAVVIMGHD